MRSHSGGVVGACLAFPRCTPESVLPVGTLGTEYYLQTTNHAARKATELKTGGRYHGAPTHSLVTSHSHRLVTCPQLSHGIAAEMFRDQISREPCHWQSLSRLAIKVKVDQTSSSPESGLARDQVQNFGAGRCDPAMHGSWMGPVWFSQEQSSPGPGTCCRLSGRSTSSCHKTRNPRP